MITACCARAPQRYMSRLYMHCLLMFHEVRPISKTRNKLMDHTTPRCAQVSGGPGPRLPALCTAPGPTQAGPTEDRRAGRCRR